MKIARKLKKADGWIGAWHVLRPGDHSRFLCKRWRNSVYRTTQVADLRSLRSGDRICRDCMDLSPELARRGRLVNQMTEIGRAL